MARWFGWRRLAVLGVTSLACAVVWLWLVPRMVAARFRTQLQQAGFSQVDLESVEVGFHQATVRNLRLGSTESGSGHLTVAIATMQFTLGDLWQARIGTLVLDQPVWTLGTLPGRASSPFDEVLRRRDDGLAVSQSSRPLPAMPVRICTIRGGRIAPASARSVLAITVDGTLAVDAEEWHCDLDASVGTHAVHATIRLRDEKELATGTAALRVNGAEPIDLAGECELAVQPEGRRLTVALRKQPGPFVVSLADVDWSGDGILELFGTVPFARLDAAALVVHVEEFRLTSTAGVQLDGLSTDLHLQGLPMPVSTAPQQLRWRNLHLAGFRAGAGQADVDLRTGPELRVHIRQRALDEIGSIDIDDLRFAPGLSRHAITAVCDQLPLRGCLELMSQGHVTGDGRLNGTLALVVQTQPRLGVDLQRGRLTAAPGGVVRFVDDDESAAMVRQHVEQVVASTGFDALMQDRLLAALKEFTYSKLEFCIDSAAGDASVTLRVHAVGQGRHVPQPLDLQVNLHGIDTAIDTAIAVSRGLESTRDRIVQPPHQPLNNPPKSRHP